MKRWRKLGLRARTRVLQAAMMITVASGITSVVASKPIVAQQPKSALVAQLVSIEAQKVATPVTPQASATALPVIDDVHPTSTEPPAAPAPVIAPAPIVTLASSDPVALGRQMNAARFGDQDWPALYDLWSRESGWNPNARNWYSGACGIPQALPCSKITDMSPTGQIQWGLNYIASRYGNPENAWSFWLAHRYY